MRHEFFLMWLLWACLLSPAMAYEPSFATDAELTPLLAELVNPKPVAVVGYEMQSFGSNTVLDNLNARRAYHNLPAYQYDAQLTEMAEREAIAVGQTRKGIGHVDGAYGPARGAGTGWRSSTDPKGDEFNSCYAAATKFRRAGVAAYVRPDGSTTYAGCFGY